MNIGRLGGGTCHDDGIFARARGPVRRALKQVCPAKPPMMSTEVAKAFINLENPWEIALTPDTLSATLPN